MKKILIAFDGTQFSKGAFEFARELNERQPILLTGAFMPQVNYANLWSYTAMATPFYAPAPAVIEDDNEDLLQENIELFESLCIKNNIAFRVHKDMDDFALQELKLETRFADLLIISSEKFFENIVDASPSDYMKDALHETECPVIVIPENFSFPARNVIAYDGSASSVYAMKQFAYIFPELAINDTLLVYSSKEEGLKFPNEVHIEELATQHFKQLEFLKLDINPKKYFNTWLMEKTDAILVCGSFGRSPLSQMFRRSFVTDIIADHRLPVFIAHHK